jgi:hypothetical protein
VDPSDIPLCQEYEAHGACAGGDECPLIHGEQCEVGEERHARVPLCVRACARVCVCVRTRACTCAHTRAIVCVGACAA